jgi:hypothetical protein
LWKSRIQNLKKANEALLAHKGDDASATEICLEESSLAKDIQFVTNILLSALEKVNNLVSYALHSIMFFLINLVQ